MGGAMDLGDAITAAGVLVALFIGATQVYVALKQKAIGDRQADIADRQAKTTAAQGGIQAVSSWLPLLKDSDPNVRFNAVVALERVGSDAALVPLIAGLSDPNGGVRNRAAAAIGRLWTPSTVEIVIELLGNQDAGTRNAAWAALQKIGIEGVEEMERAIEHAEPNIKAAGLEAIGRIRLNEQVMRQISALQAHELLQAGRGALGDPSVVMPSSAAAWTSPYRTWLTP